MVTSPTSAPQSWVDIDRDMTAIITSLGGAEPLGAPVTPRAKAATRAQQAPATFTPGEQRLLDNWLAIQAVNLNRHAKSLRPFTKEEFGSSPAAPSEAHIEAVNRFVDSLRVQLVEMARWVEAAANAARRDPASARLGMVLERKQEVGNRVLYVETIWDFYFDLFVQRLSAFGERLRTIDRIAANCYEDLYTSVGTAQPTPTLLPFSYAQSGFSPATFRRGVPLTKLRRNRNLFPLIMLPQHRLDNVWALSSVLHEVSHNLQFDVGLWDEIPKRINSRLTTEGKLSPHVVGVWTRWHKEMMADMFALILGGPAAVESLMDVVGRAPESTLKFSAEGVHPTPYLRVLINLVLLRRMGFERTANDLRRVWLRLYPRPTANDIPTPIMQSFDTASELAVDTMVFQPYRQFGNKSLAQVMPFGAKEMGMIEQAGRALAAGKDPGLVPLRLMIGAARYALDNRMAKPQDLTDTFYRTLGRR